MTPIATPVVFGGISQNRFRCLPRNSWPTDSFRFRRWRFGGHHPLAKANEKTLTPGTSVSVQLVRGDYSIAASGTVTFRDGDRIYAFGHPF